jgi:hypothetical protein
MVLSAAYLCQAAEQLCAALASQPPPPSGGERRQQQQMYVAKNAPSTVKVTSPSRTENREDNQSTLHLPRG